MAGPHLCRSFDLAKDTRVKLGSESEGTLFIKSWNDLEVGSAGAILAAKFGFPRTMSIRFLTKACYFPQNNV